MGDGVSICCMYLVYFLATQPAVTHPCVPSPCGVNARCEVRNDLAVCACLPEYFGDPYVACNPECVVDQDCDPKLSCSNMKCIDPCIGTCGINAQCRVNRHHPLCSCPIRYTGDPFTRCTPIPEQSKPSRKILQHFFNSLTI